MKEKLFNFLKENHIYSNKCEFKRVSYHPKYEFLAGMGLYNSLTDIVVDNKFRYAVSYSVDIFKIKKVFTETYLGYIKNIKEEVEDRICANIKMRLEPVNVHYVVDKGSIHIDADLTPQNTCIKVLKDKDENLYSGLDKIVSNHLSAPNSTIGKSLKLNVLGIPILFSKIRYAIGVLEYAQDEDLLYQKILCNLDDMKAKSKIHLEEQYDSEIIFNNLTCNFNFPSERSEACGENTL